ncbi:MAG: hypothetical protein NVV63_04630 [Opitutus sp.]|nr:hypothetical protein [Opitutus sp.]
MAVALGSLGADSASAASTYQADSALADYSGITESGGTIVVPFVLKTGDALPGLGTSFDVTYTFSAITAYHFSETGITWKSGPAEGAPPSYISLPNPDGMFTSLPAQNVTSLPYELGGSTATTSEGDYWFEAALDEGLLVPIGHYTVSTSAAPVVPGYDIISQYASHGYGWGILGVDDGAVHGGWFAYPDDPDDDYRALGVTVGFNLVAFSSSGELPPDYNPLTAMWASSGYVTFEVAAIPEPSTYAVVLALAAGTLVVVKRLRRRAS